MFEVIVTTQSSLTADLLNALCEAWLAHETAENIGVDVEKIQLLKRAAKDGVDPEQLSESVQALYRKVFLRTFSEVAAEA